jgi:hypothetical protein
MGYSLCTDEPVTVTAVRVETTGQVLSTESWIYASPPGESRGKGREPLGAAPGRASRLRVIEQTWLAPAPGASVGALSCDDPGLSFLQLLLSVRTGSEGARVDGVTVDYEYDGRSYSATNTSWVFILCGSDVSDHCSG